MARRLHRAVAVFAICAGLMPTVSITAAQADETPAAVAPGVPTGVSARAGTNAARVYFGAAADGNWMPVNAYTVTSTPGGLTCTSRYAGSCQVTGLSNGQPYTFDVTATNDAGTSEPATTNVVTPAADTHGPVIAGFEVTPNRVSTAALERGHGAPAHHR